jgi:5-(carboxyamino)imidazole ribonucleotide mutase
VVAISRRTVQFGFTFPGGASVLGEEAVRAIQLASRAAARRRPRASAWRPGRRRRVQDRSTGKALVQSPRVGLIMGSQSDWPTLRHAATVLDELAIAHEDRIVSAHRTPKRLVEYATTARERGLQVIIAAAGGAAHLPGMVAAMTTLPVLGVPVESRALRGMDSLLSIVQMPGGVPVGTLAIGRAGAINAALLAASILGLHDAAVAHALEAWRAAHTAAVPEAPADQGESGG